MKIALFTDGIWPYVIGGMQKHSYFLCRYFARNKINILLIHTSARISEDIIELSCFSEEEKKYIHAVWVAKPKVKSFPGHYIYQSWLYSREIYHKLGGFPDVDFIIAKGMTGWYFLTKKGRTTPRIGINIHGYEFMQKKANFKMYLESLLLRFPLTWVNRNADYVFSYGGKITGLIRNLGVPQDKIIEAPSAIEPEWMNDTNTSVHNPLQFVFIGRYERRKGIEEINRVAGDLFSKGYDFKFSFVGPIPSDKQLSFPKAQYYGKVVDKNILQKILTDADILVCPSYAEGMPNVIFEGMANGCAVIATDVGAVSILVNDKNGWLIPPANIEGLRQAMEQAIKSSSTEIREKKIAAYNHIAKHFIWEDVSKKLLHSIKTRVDNQ